MSLAQFRRGKFEVSSDIKQHCPRLILCLRVEYSLEFSCDCCPDSVGQFGVSGPEEDSTSHELFAFQFSPRQNLRSLLGEIYPVRHSQSEIMLIIRLLPERPDEVPPDTALEFEANSKCKIIVQLGELRRGGYSQVFDTGPLLSLRSL